MRRATKQRFAPSFRSMWMHARAWTCMQLKRCSRATLTSLFLAGSGARDAASWCGVLWPALKARAVNGPLPWCRSGSSRPMWRSRMDVMKLLGWQVVGPVRCGLRWCWRAVRMVGELRRSETCCLRLRGRSRWYGAGRIACPAEQHSRNQNQADEGVGRGPGGPPHESSQAAKILTSSSTD